MCLRQLGCPSRSSAERLLFLNCTCSSPFLGITTSNSPICTAALSVRYSLFSFTPALQTGTGHCCHVSCTALCDPGKGITSTCSLHRISGKHTSVTVTAEIAQHMRGHSSPAPVVHICRPEPFIHAYLWLLVDREVTYAFCQLLGSLRAFASQDVCNVKGRHCVQNLQKPVKQHLFGLLQRCGCSINSSCSCDVEALLAIPGEQKDKGPMPASAAVGACASWPTVDITLVKLTAHGAPHHVTLFSSAGVHCMQQCSLTSGSDPGLYL